MFQEHVDRLRAEECLSDRLVIASGSATLKDEVNRELVAIWSRAANVGRPQDKAPRKSADRMKSQLGSIGIGMKVD